MAELSMLERRLEEISADPPTPSLSKPQLEALAATLERHEATRGAASALRAGDLGTAARRLRQAISESQDAPALAADLAEELSRPDGALSAEERDQLLASLHGDTDPAPVSVSANAPARGASLQSLTERLGAQAATAGDGGYESVRPSISPLLASIEMLRSELQDAISSAWAPPGIRA